MEWIEGVREDRLGKWREGEGGLAVYWGLDCVLITKGKQLQPARLKN